jgi:membrane peptidoglycan carboxypeptidase
MKRTTKMSRISKRPKKKASKAPLAIIISAVFTLFTIFLVVVALLTTAGVAAYRYYNSVVPGGLQSLAAYEAQPYQVSLVQDRKGYTLQELVNPNLGTRVLVPLNKIPYYVKQATIDTEDRTFYTNQGIDPVRLLSAARSDLSNTGGLQGASTLTQQLVKLAVFGSNAGTPRKLDQTNLQNKLKEIMIAIGVTQQGVGGTSKSCDLKCRKDAILQMYLNTVPYGSSGGAINGVEAAAEYYFGVHVGQLDLAQSALIAGLPQAPSQYNPVTSPDLAAGRQHHVLDRMLAEGHITKLQHDAAENEPLHYVFKSLVSHRASATIESYFVDWLINDYLSSPANLQQFGIPDLQQPNDIYRGFIFKTTLDPDWQSTAQNIVTSQVASLGSLNVTDGALVAIDPKSNEIKAFVGGVGYGATIQCPQCDMAWRPRQPGSSFKPFMYVTAFMNGHFPAETINDAYVTFPDFGPGGGYTPKNYDLSYHGLVTIRQALANSYNVPAVKTLYALGPDGIPKVLHTANIMGYHLIQQDPKQLGLSMALGADEGRLIDETNAYAVFANNGIYRPYMPILEIDRVNADGTRTQVWKYKTPKGVQVIAPQFAYLITSILSDTAAKVPAFGSFAYSYLGLPDRPVASKTGTTSDFKDNLTMGYTPDLVTGVWVGNPNDTPMYGSTGITGAAPAWHQFMYTVLQNTTPQQFVMPTGILTATVARFAPADSLPGLSTTGSGITDIFAAGTVPTTYDDPSQDVYTGRTGQPGAPKSTTTTTTNPTTTTYCNGGRYRYTTVVKGGQTYYKVQCL